MFQQLQTAKNEKDIENAYRAELLRVAKGGQITSPYKTDGLFEMSINGNGTKARTLLEFKYDTELKSPISRAGVLVQCLYYLRRFQAAGEQLPSTILVADQNECFVIHTNAIAGYLTEKIDWNIAASEASKRNPDLVSRIATDPAVTPFVYEVNPKFSLREVLEKIIALTKNTVRLVLVSRFNVQAIFDYFSRNILDARTPSSESKSSAGGIASTSLSNLESVL